MLNFNVLYLDTKTLYLNELYILNQSSFKGIKFTLLICSLMQQDLPKSNQAIYSMGRTSGTSVSIFCLEFLCSCDSESWNKINTKSTSQWNMVILFSKQSCDTTIPVLVTWFWSYLSLQCFPKRLHNSSHTCCSIKGKIHPKITMFFNNSL